ncbi:MAG: hypothetical protein HRU00_04235, partial [Myxococcales bacterium]|nr:hypothetical protein [Myxococcales bacterium]
AAEISLNHYANLSLFHVICTLQFSPDAGYCGFDQLNTPETWHLVSDALGTGALTTFISPNSLTMQSASFPFTGFSLFSFQNAIFANAQNSSPLNLSQESAETQALLGCGPLFLSPCDSPGLAEMTTDFAFMCTWASEDSTGVTLQNPEACDPDNFVDGLPVTAPAEIRVIGGIDFMNARADVLMQDFTLIKYMEAGGYIGTALGDCPADRKFGGQCFLPGIKLPDLANPQSLAPTDYAIEGMTFPINEEWAARGVLLFKTQPEDRLDNGSDGSVPGIENCTPFPDAVKYSGGATPRRLIDPGCSVLESYSANLERLLIERDIAGSDRYFDPPESFAELSAMLDEDPENDITGDPHSGPDGLLSINLDITVPPAAGSSLYTPDTFLFIQDAADFDPGNPNSDYNLDRDYIKDTYAVLDASNARVHPLDPSIPIPPQADGTPGRACQPTVTLASGDQFFRGYCFQYLAPSGIPRLSQTPSAAASPSLDNGPLLAALPINLNVCPLASGCDDQTDNIGIDPRVLTGEQLMALDLGQVVELTAEQNPIKNDPVLSGAITIVDGIRCANQQVDGVTRRVCGQARIGGATNVWGLKNLDLNNDFILDLDQDGDGVLDFLDNNTPGPVSDDNVLCGSGLPGDILQDVKQFDFIFENTDLQKLQERFPNNGIMNAAGEVQWLPPRSPIFCSSLVGLMSATGRTYAFKEAGGNGLVGRRSFQWHGGSQLGIFYQKRNVFGLGLDFAEDTTKSSWGLEFSWSKDSIVSNVKEPIGYNLADEYVLTVSVDRPTFINFLNPNRTFFINFQFFLNWLSSYDKEANFGARPYQLDGLVTLTFFTGYFQDRLNPRVTMIWFPMSGTYGMLTGVGYRWNERFSTSLGLNYFWGRKNLARGNYFQFLRTTPYEKSEVFRGTGAVQNRDVATMTFRYTW